MNASLRISVFAQTTGSSTRTLTGVELTIHNVDSSDVPVELAGCTVMWHNAISVNHDETDRTLTVEKPADATCESFDKLVGTEIAAQRKKLATHYANRSVLTRTVKIDVSGAMIEAILARTSGHLADMSTDQSDNDALGKLLGLADTDFGAADLFTEAYPLDVIDLQGAAQLV